MLAAAATVVIYPILAMVWILQASMGARRIARAACGGGCVAVLVVDGVSTAAAAAVLVLGLVSLVVAVCSICVAACTTKPDRADALNDDDVTTPGDQPVLCVLMFGMLAFLALLLLTLVGLLLITFSHVKGSHTERSGSIIMDIGVFSLVVLNCFIVLPALALFVWRRMSVIVWQLI
ncbi:unnamed protein product [Urochloa humidicola]